MHISKIKICFLLAGVLVFTAVPAKAQEQFVSNANNLTAEEMAPLALTDSMYYHFDEWFARFAGEINRLESASPSLENRIELMKYHFNYAGLLGELCHTLAFTSKYQDKKITKDFLYHSRRVKDLAHDILDSTSVTPDQKAHANLYLGAAEGYIGIFEYGQGNLIIALINGFQADNHLEKALFLNPKLADAYFGLGMYRYGNSRLGGLGNLMMQGGKDLRLIGLNHIEHAILNGAAARPLALKTLAWFYISEQINPENRGLPPDNPLSRKKTRQNAIGLLIDLDNLYFKKPAPHSHFRGNKELAMMKPSAFLINCARGPIIDEPTLYTALRDGQIGGAGLDVMEQAAPPADHPLFKLYNLLVTPHVGFLSQQSVHELEVRTAKATVDVLQGHMPEFLVNPTVLPHSRVKLA